ARDAERVGPVRWPTASSRPVRAHRTGGGRGRILAPVLPGATVSSPAARSASAPHDFNPDHRDQNLGPLMRLLVVIEKAGNKLPHPFWLFMGLALVVMVLSWFLERAGVSAVNPADGETVTPTNLLAGEELRSLLGGLVENFVLFPPLGLVLAVLFGVAVSEQSGLIKTVMKATLKSASPRL